WWHDVDAWLAVAGYPPRRDFLPNRPNRPPVIRIEPLTPGPEARPASHPPSPPAPRDVEGRSPGAPEAMAEETDSAAGELAAHYYRPVYERLPWGDAYVHIFWLLDRNNEKTYQIRYPPAVD